MIEIKFFKTPNGKVPFREWYYGLKDKKSQSKITERFNRIVLGNFGNYKALGNGLYELKIDYGPGYRVYYGFKGKEVVIILCGGDKGSQAKDIKIAEGYWFLYKEHKNGNGRSTNV